MELLTDVLAIAGWSFFGGVMRGIVYAIRKHKDDKFDEDSSVYFALSFGLIAASLVLG